MKLRITLGSLLMLMALIALASAGGMAHVVGAQVATSAAVTASPMSSPTLPPDQLSITWPVPVTELWGKQDVQGTVNFPDLDHYLFEMQPLNPDLSMPAGSPWTPASGAQSKPVQQGVLATLDVSGVPDGLYSLRLSAFNKTGGNFFFVVTPLRVSNARFAAILTGTPTPTRRAVTAIPRTPVTGVVLNGIALVPSTPVCGQTYTVQVNVNNPTRANTALGTVTVQDVNVRTGDVTATGTGSFPVLAPGQNAVVAIPVTTTQFYNETHQVRAFVGNSQITATYALQQGNCNITLTPSQTFTGVPPTSVPPTTAPSASVAPTTAVPPTASKTTAPATAAATP